jgi:hypothetical protein
MTKIHVYMSQHENKYMSAFGLKPFFSDSDPSVVFDGCRLGAGCWAGDDRMRVEGIRVCRFGRLHFG